MRCPRRRMWSLSGELEQIAAAAAERLRALTAGDVERDADLQRRVGEAASRAIAAGLSLAAIADAEQIGQAAGARGVGPGASATGGAGRTPQARSGARVRRGDRPRGAAWALRIATWRRQRRWRTARCARSSPARAHGLRRSTPRQPRARPGQSSGQQPADADGVGRCCGASKRDPPTRQARDRRKPTEHSTVGPEGGRERGGGRQAGRPGRAEARDAGRARG